MNSSPFPLNATIRHHLSFYSSSDPDFVEDVVRPFCVDDLASSRPNGASAYEFYLKVKFRFKEAGFNMRKWLTNDQNLASRIQCEEANQSYTPLLNYNKMIKPSQSHSFIGRQMKSFRKCLGQPGIPKRITLCFHSKDSLSTLKRRPSPSESS